MTAYEPHLTYESDLPVHFKRRADDTENDADNYTEDDAGNYTANDYGAAADDADDDQADESFADAVADDEEGVNPFAIAVVAATLVIGIAVGAGATVLWMSSHDARPPPTAVASRAPPAAGPARLAIARTAPPVEAVAPAPAAKSASPRAHTPAARHRAAPTRLATACGAGGTHRETMICAWPAIAAADRDMRRAYQHALDAGVERSSLQASQDEWLITSELAAGRSAADLSAAYHRRIGELNALAADEPPR